MKRHEIEALMGIGFNFSQKEDHDLAIQLAERVAHEAREAALEEAAKVADLKATICIAGSEHDRLREAADGIRSLKRGGE